MSCPGSTRLGFILFFPFLTTLASPPLLSSSPPAMVTLEKWYTPCGSQGPTQAGPECDVESKMFTTFKQLRALKPEITLVMYWNSMFDFSFYQQHQRMIDLEAKGEHAYLRDINGKVASLCNDGNVYCNITTFDHTNPDVRQLWIDQVRNAVANGSVDGIFADHAYNNPVPMKGHPGFSQLCNGAGAGRKCFQFTTEFGTKFKAAHTEMLNYTQDILAKGPGKGPVICGPLSRWNVGTDFKTLLPVVRRGVEDATAPFVIEASRGGCTLASDESKLAGFLSAMEQYTYLSCFTSNPPTWYDVYDKPLGVPTGVAVESATGSGVYTRNFTNAKGVTRVTYDSKTEAGLIWWAGDPAPAPTPPPTPAPPAPQYCTKPRHEGMANADLGGEVVVASYANCCMACKAKAKCTQFAWHHEEGNVCHFHTAKATPSKNPGCMSGYVNNTLASGE